MAFELWSLSVMNHTMNAMKKSSIADINSIADLQPNKELLEKNES
jgi:hypothetical protein